jgi:membrane-anchored protein YejM (alkaline phosphatase superfamily)
MFLKVVMVIQLVLILLKLQKEDSVIYLLSEVAFKIFLGLFLMVYFLIAGSSDFDFWDEVFISFGGGLLMFDAVYNVLPKVFLRYGIHFNPYTFYLSYHPENGATESQEQTL